MPETAFILQEDEALKTYLQGLTVNDASSPQGGRNVEVWYRTPEMEERERRYPYITIDLLDISESQEPGRHNNGKVKLNSLAYRPPPPVLTETVDHTLVAMRPVPINLDYQVTVNSRSARHDRQLWALLWRKFPGRWGALAIPGDGTARSMFLLATAGSADMDESGKRLFRRIFTVRVLSELWPEDIRNITNLRMITFTFTLPFDASFYISELDCHDPY